MGVAIAAAVLVVSACSPAPTPLVTTAADAKLTVTGSGRVGCYPALICVASLVLLPDPTGASPVGPWAVPPGRQFSFASIQTPIFQVTGVGPLTDPVPAGIAPGRYHLGGVSTSIDDRPTPVPTPGPNLVFPVCAADLTIAANTSVHVAVNFSPFAKCSIATSVGAETAAP